VKKLRVTRIYGTDKLKEECGEMTLLVLDKAFCGRYVDRNCNKYNETLGFNIKHIVSQIILHYVLVMSLFNVKRWRVSNVVELLTSTSVKCKVTPLQARLWPRGG
jgi:hypothetical protein